MRSAGEKDLGEEFLLESGKGGCWVSVRGAGGGYKLKSQTDDCGEGLRDICDWLGEVVQGHIGWTGEVMP